METELFVHYAEIAGVFVGFGALISLRSAHVSDPHDLVYLLGVLSSGIWVVIAALVPIAVTRYGVDGHPLWLSCALVALAAWAALVIALNRTSGSRAINRNPESLDRYFPIVGLPLHLVIAGSLILTILGVLPEQEAALYVTALTSGVIFGGYTLLVCVLSQRHEAGSGPEA